MMMTNTDERDYVIGYFVYLGEIDEHYFVFVLPIFDKFSILLGGNWYVARLLIAKEFSRHSVSFLY